MKLALAAVGLLGLVVLVCAAAAVVNLQTFVAARGHEVLDRAERSLARPIHAASLDLSWWPLGIRATDVVMGEDPRFGAGPFLEAGRVRIAVRPLALARGLVEVSRVILERPRLVLIRDRRGWNVASLGITEGRRSDAAAALLGEGSAAGDGSMTEDSGSTDENRHKRAKRRRAARIPLGWWLGLTPSEIRDGRVEIEDRTGTTPRRFRAERIGVRVDGVRFGAEAHLRLAALLVFDGGASPMTLDVRLPRLGESDLDRTPFVARFELRDLDLAVLEDVLGERARSSGRLQLVTGTATGNRERWSADVEARSAGEAIGLGGNVVLPAMPLRLAARATSERGVVAFADLRGDVGTLAFRGSGRVELEPWRADVRVTSEPHTELAVGLAEPPLVVSDVAATLVCETSHCRLTSGAVRIDGSPIEIAGTIASLAPPALSSRFRADAFGGTLAGKVEIAPRGAHQTVRVRAVATALDAGRVTARFASRLTQVEGRANGSLALEARLGTERSVLRSMAGSGHVTLMDGRLPHVNVAQSILRPVRQMELVPRGLAARLRARHPGVFDATDTPLRTASIPFSIADGRISSGRIAVTAGSYDVVGEGWMDLDRRLKFRGDLLLSEADSAALSADFRVARWLLTDGRVSLPFRAEGLLGAAGLEPDAKRLGARGLRLLMSDRGDRRRGRTRERASDGGRPTPDRAAPMIDRLERMLRP